MSDYRAVWNKYIKGQKLDDGRYFCKIMHEYGEISHDIFSFDEHTNSFRTPDNDGYGLQGYISHYKKLKLVIELMDSASKDIS